MDKKKLLPYWLSIPCILIFIGGFRLVFGQANAIVGLMFFMTLVIISHFNQMQIRPLRDGGIIAVTILGIELATTLAARNPYLGLAVNLVALFTIIYVFFGNFQGMLFLPPLTAYLYLANAPEARTGLATRVIALIVGTLLLILALEVLQRYRANITPAAKLRDLLFRVAGKARELGGTPNPDYIYTSTDEIRKALHALFAQIYRSEKHRHRTRELDEGRMDVALALEHFALVIRDCKYDATHLITADERRFFSNLADVLETVGTDFGAPGTAQRGSELFAAFAASHTAGPDASGALYDLLATCEVLAHQLARIGHGFAHRDEEEAVVKTADARWMYQIRHALKPDRLRINYALKIAITTSAILFGAHFVPLPNAQWLAFMVAFLMRPYAEDTTRLSRARLKGTLAGAALFLLVFSVVHGYWWQLGIIMVTYLIYTRCKPVTLESLTCSTFAALGSMALLTGDFATLGIERVGYLFAALLISAFVGNVIAPFHLVSDTAQLLVLYRTTTYELLEVFLYAQLHRNEPAILHDTVIKNTDDTRSLELVTNGLLMNANLIELQVGFNNRRLRADEISDFIMDGHRLLNDLYFFFATLPETTAHTEVIRSLLGKLARVNALFLRVSEQAGAGPGIRGRRVREQPAGTPEFFVNPDLLEACAELSHEIEAAFGFCEDRAEKMALSTLDDIAAGLKRHLMTDLSARAIRARS